MLAAIVVGLTALRCSRPIGRGRPNFLWALANRATMTSGEGSCVATRRAVDDEIAWPVPAPAPSSVARQPVAPLGDPSRRPRRSVGSLAADERGGMVGAAGFEPTTLSSRTIRATKLRHAPTGCPLRARA